MKHFTSEEWADFVRSVTAPEQTQVMQAHLQECPKCEGVEAIWRAMLRHGAQAGTQTGPSASALHLVKATFAAQKNRNGLPRAVRFARLVFDSFLDPLPAGARAAVVPTGSRVRQILFGSAPYVLDIRMEQEPASTRVHLVGQVMHSAGREGALKDVPVYLRNGTDSLMETISNLFGEFHFEFESGKSLLLLVKIPQQEPICMPLPDLSSPIQSQATSVRG